MKKNILFSSIVILTLFAACKKDSSPKAITRTDFLTTGSWKLIAVVSDDDGDGTYEKNDYKGFEACFTDNLLTFKKDGTLQLDEGPTKCEPTAPQNDASTWKLLENDTKIMIATDTWLVQELSASTLKWKEVYEANRTSVVTFAKQ